MNIDGYVLLEINLKGEAKYHSGDFFDIRLQYADFDSDYIKEEMSAQLPEKLNDVLVMCLFKYRSESSYDSWSGVTEYVDCFDLVSHHVVQSNYKEFYRMQITEEINVGVHGVDNLDMFPDDRNYYKDIVAEWEEFYDEDFKPTVKNNNSLKLTF